MPDYSIKHMDEFEFYQGENEVEGMRFIYAGKGLGVSAWGMNIIKMDPNCNAYPEHEHSKDGQEEVYVVLKGKAIFTSENAEVELEPGMMVRVGPKQKRKFKTGPEDGATILAIGATPGEPYKKA